MTDTAETSVYTIGFPADAVDEIINFVGHRMAKDQYVPYCLINLADALAGMIKAEGDDEGYEEIHQRLMQAKDGVSYGGDAGPEV